MKDYLEISRVLDRQVIDINNVNCGKVDDLELEQVDAQLRIKAILMGVGVAADRLPALPRVLVQKFFGRRTVRIPWERVSVINERIKLDCESSECEMDEARTFAQKIVGKLPGAWKK